MIILSSTSDKLRVVTDSTANTDVHASWADLTVGTGATTADRKNTAIGSATTTDVVSSPSSGVVRTVKTLHIRNKHATLAQTVTVQHTDGTTAVEQIQINLPAGYVLHYDEGAGFEVQDAYGRGLANWSANGSGAAVNALNMVVLTSDVTNANAVANTMQDITGLAFSVTAGETYYFRFIIDFTAAALTTGSRFSISGPGAPTRLAYRTVVPSAGTSETLTVGITAYDLPAAAVAATPALAGNVAQVEGFITPSASGSVIARFASEVAASAIVAKAGSLCTWVRVL